MTATTSKPIRKITQENVSLDDMKLLGFDDSEAAFYLRIAKGEDVPAVIFEPVTMVAVSKHQNKFYLRLMGI